MNRWHLLTCAALATLALGCPSDDDATTGNADTSSESSNSSPTTTMTPTTTTPTTTDMTTADTSAETTADTSATMGSSEESSSSTTVDPTIFMFNDTPPDQYVRVDRMGFPAVNTALHIGGDKDQYNLESPETDVGSYFDANLAEIVTVLRLLHFGPDNAAAGTDGIDDELAMLFGPGSACTPPSDVNPVPGECVDQGGGAAVLPDTLKLDLDLPNGFHIDPSTCGPVANGRALDNPVIDIELAILTLDLGLAPWDEDSGIGFQCDPECVPGDGTCVHSRATTYLNLPGGLPMLPAEAFSLNPIANDVEFQADFPYLAPAHAP